MQTRNLIRCLPFLLLFAPSCKKNKDDTPSKSKTELLVSSSWKFDKATAGIVNLANYLEECITDNTIAFNSTASEQGSGVIDEGATTCDPGDPQTITFNWTIQENGTKLVSDTPFFAGGSGTFNLVTLTETSLVVSQQMTISPYPSTLVTFTFKH